MPIQLTNPGRKKQPAQKPKQFFVEKTADGKLISTAKYSKVFQDAGHDFVKSYEVVRLSYWLEYDLIGHDECALYDTLHLFAKKNLEFTTDYLAKALKVSRSTLRQQLDNLENAELIEVIKVNDELGQRNDYLIKSPFYKRADFNETKQHRIIRAGEELPEIFLESQAERLQNQIKRNVVKKQRRIIRRKDLKGRRAEIRRCIVSAVQDRFLVWKRLVHTFGENHAIKFDRLVWRILQYSHLQKFTGDEYRREFLTVLKRECERENLGWSKWYDSIADDLRGHYEPRLRTAERQRPAQTYDTQTTADSPPSDHNSAERRENELNLLRTIITEKTANVTNYTKSLFDDLVRIFKTYAANLEEIEIEAAAEVLPGEVWQKLKVEIIS